MDEQEDIREDMIFYLSECLDISIKAAKFAENEPEKNAMYMEILNDILNTARLILEKMDLENAEENSKS